MAGDDLDAEAALVTATWLAAPDLSLAHDVSEGGLAVALTEMALASGTGIELQGNLPELDRRGAIVVAGPREARNRFSLGLRELGVVAGDSVLGTPLAELHTAWGEL